MKHKTILAAMFCALLWGCGTKSSDSQSDTRVTFAFMTDVHLNASNSNQRNSGFQKALDDAKAKGAEFILFGGDNVDCDHIGDHESTADSLHAKFRSIVDQSGIPSFFTMGNHDRQYVFDNKRDSLGFSMFEKHIGKSECLHFEQSGIHFITLNAMHYNPSGGYSIDSVQTQWLVDELRTIGTTAPIVVSTHVPLLTLYYPVVEGNFKPYDIIGNTKEIVDILKPYNVKIILQGHQHIYEQIYERDLWFVTGGAVCASWWGGPLQETQEGYLLIKVDKQDNFEWEYVDFGWEPQK